MHRKVDSKDMEKDIDKKKKKSICVLHYYEIGNKQKRHKNKTLSVEEMATYW